jgi:hypothetical protein
MNGADIAPAERILLGLANIHSPEDKGNVKIEVIGQPREIKISIACENKNDPKKTIWIVGTGVDLLSAMKATLESGKEQRNDPS